MRQQPESLMPVLQMAELYRDEKRYQEAFQWVEQAFRLANRGDHSPSMPTPASITRSFSLWSWVCCLLVEAKDHFQLELLLGNWNTPMFPRN